VEIALNLVWLGVSVALLVICGVHVARAGEDRSRYMAAVALVCLVCFLFPVISMTDDLNSSGPALLEPSKLKNVLSHVPALVTLLPWIALLMPQENGRAVMERQRDARLPLQEILTFSLSRRPPPARLVVS
jgi:hypothetical protein